MRISVGPRPFSISYSLLTLAPSPPARLVFSLLHDSLDFLCMEVVVVSSNLILGTSIWAPGAGSGIEKKNRSI